MNTKLDRQDIVNSNLLPPVLSLSILGTVCIDSAAFNYYSTDTKNSLHGTDLLKKTKPTIFVECFSYFDSFPCNYNMATTSPVEFHKWVWASVYRSAFIDGYVPKTTDGKKYTPLFLSLDIITVMRLDYKYRKAGYELLHQGNMLVHTPSGVLPKSSYLEYAHANKESMRDMDLYEFSNLLVCLPADLQINLRKAEMRKVMEALC